MALGGTTTRRRARSTTISHLLTWQEQILVQMGFRAVWLLLEANMEMPVMALITQRNHGTRVSLRDLAWPMRSIRKRSHVLVTGSSSDRPFIPAGVEGCRSTDSICTRRLTRALTVPPQTPPSILTMVSRLHLTRRPWILPLTMGPRQVRPTAMVLLIVQWMATADHIPNSGT